MQGRGALLRMVVVAFAHVVCNPSVFAASLIPNRDTPSVVAEQSLDIYSGVYILL